MLKRTKVGFSCITTFLAVGSLLFFGILQVNTAAADETIKWRLLSSWPSGSKLYDETLPKIRDKIQKRTNGKVKITLYPPGSLAKVGQTFENVAAGTVEMACSTGLYNANKIPEGVIESGLPFSFTGPPFTFIASKKHYDFLYNYKDGKAFELFQDAYAERGVHLLAIGTSSSLGYMTTFKATTLDDFKGKKIRSYGPFSMLTKKMGASPVSLPAADTYMAISRGTVDGTIFVYYVLETYKLKEVVDYVILPPVCAAPACNFYINQKAWEKVSDENQRIIEQTILEEIKVYSREAVKFQKSSIDKVVKEGVELVQMDDDTVEKLRELSIPIWETLGKKSERSAQVVEILKEYLGAK